MSRSWNFLHKVLFCGWAHSILQGPSIQYGFHKHLQNKVVYYAIIKIFSQSIFEHFHALFCISFFHLFGHPSLVLIESPTSFRLKEQCPVAITSDNTAPFKIMANHIHPKTSFASHGHWWTMSLSQFLFGVGYIGVVYGFFFGDCCILGLSRL